MLPARDGGGDPSNEIPAIISISRHLAASFAPLGHDDCNTHAPTRGVGQYCQKTEQMHMTIRAKSSFLKAAGRPHSPHCTPRESPNGARGVQRRSSGDWGQTRAETEEDKGHSHPLQVRQERLLPLDLGAPSEWPALNSYSQGGGL